MLIYSENKPATLEKTLAEKINIVVNKDSVKHDRKLIKKYMKTERKQLLLNLRTINNN